MIMRVNKTNYERKFKIKTIKKTYETKENLLLLDILQQSYTCWLIYVTCSRKSESVNCCKKKWKKPKHDSLKQLVFYEKSVDFKTVPKSKFDSLKRSMKFSTHQNETPVALLSVFVLL